ncbi:hypothetical protein RJ55_05347 [Drechmeria coniospora]|nr:hypothetical protein RJ55_05347 [Drechmeria coniospora]
MSRLFPHTAYAEDQPLARTVLTTHVLTRAVTTGTIVGVTVATARHIIPSLRRPGTLPAKVLRASATGSLVGLGLTSVVLVARMHGREDIEWRDRSWRLLENEGQLETDDWTYVGMGAAAAAAIGTGKVNALGYKALVGAMGLGSVGGMVGYMIWRYGIYHGKFPERKTTERTGGI